MNKMYARDLHNRTQGGVLVVDNKWYPVYKGVNIIGRNKSATVNIKNLNVSQNHAIIIIVEEGQHYVSDLNSSNGTYLHGGKISPLKLYELLQDAEVKFGDVVGVYSKMPNANSTIHLEASVDQSQSISQSFYSIQTQLLDATSLVDTLPCRPQQDPNNQTQDIHECATQVFHYPQKFESKESSSATEEITVDIHNAPTQVITLSPKPSTSKAAMENIHEMATQVISFPLRNISIEDIHEAVTQVNIHEAATQGNIHEAATQVTINEAATRGNIHEAATQVVMLQNDEKRDITDTSLNVADTNKVDERRNDSFNLHSIIEQSVVEDSVIEESVMEEVPCPTTTIAEIQRMKEGENSNESIDFLPVSSSPAVTTQTNEVDNKNLTPLDTQEIKIPTKKPVRRLSSSQSTVESLKNNETHSSDSETDIEDVGVNKLRKKKLKKLSSEDSDTQTVSTNDNLVQNGNKKATVNSDSETDIEDNLPVKDICPSNKEKEKPSSSQNNKELETQNKYNSDSETDIDDDQDISSTQANVDKQTPSNEPLEKSRPQESKAEDDNSEKDSQVISRKRSNKVRIIDSDSETDIEDDKNDTAGPEITRPKMFSKKPDVDSGSDTEIEEDKKEYEVKAQEENDSNSTEILDETDYIPATQDAFASMFQYKAAKVTNSKRNSDNVSSEESFKLGLTEMMVDEKDISDSSDNTKKSKNISEKISIDKPTEKERNEMEDLYLMATQKIGEASSNKNKETLNVHAAKESNKSISDIVGKEKDTGDFYIMPTKGKITEDILSMATQPINHADEELYMMATQKIDEKSPNKNKESRNSEPSKVCSSKDTEDFYIMPTQKIDQHKKIEYVPSMATQPNNIDEDLYLMATQKISEVKEVDKKEKTVEKEKPALTLDKEDVYLMPTQAIDTEANREQEVEDNLYSMPTQKINEDDSNFKAPQKFTFKKKSANLDGSLTTILGSKPQVDPYSIETQKVDVCDKTGVQSKPNENNVDDAYLQPTQMLEDPYGMETQKLDQAKGKNAENTETQNKLYVTVNPEIVAPSTSRAVAEQNDLYDLPTQPIVTEKPMITNKKSSKVPMEVTPSTSCEISEQNDLYDLPTQPIIAEKPAAANKKSSKVTTEVIPSTSREMKEQNDLYDLPTQPIIAEKPATVNKKSSKVPTEVTPSTSCEISEQNHLYDLPTQPIIAEKPATANKKSSKVTTEVIPSTSREMKEQNDLYDLPTQPIIPEKPATVTKMSSKVPTEVTPSTSSEIPEQNDLYDLPTQRIIAEKSATTNKKSIEVIIEHPTRSNISGVKRAGDASTTGNPKMKKVKKSDIEALKKTIESKKIEEKGDDDRPETLSQIEAFVKQPIKKASVGEKDTNLKPKNLQESETLSQIEAFIKKTTDEDRPETLSQIQSFIKKPLPPKPKQAAKNKVNSASTSKIDDEPEAPNSSSTRRTRGKPSETVNHEEKQEAIPSNPNNPITIVITKDSDEDNNSETNTNKTHSDQDVGKSDMDMSFAMLEVKNAKVRKSHRVSNVEKVTVAITKNRRSMAISSTAENDVRKNLPSTRKSRRITNNNTEPALGTKTKDKSENYDSDFSEPEVPPKLMKTNSTKRVVTKASASNKKIAPDKKNVDNKENKEVKDIPKISKTTVSVSTEKGKSDIPVTPTTRRGANKKTVDELSTPSTSKARASTRAVKSRSDHNTDTSDAESISSNDTVLTTPSRRGRKPALNDSPLNITERSKRKLRPKVVFTMLDSPKLESLIRHLGGSIVDTVDSCTVLVTEHVKRSQKLLSAVGQGKPICSPEWINASKKANEFLVSQNNFVDPWDHILKDEEAESKWNFSLKESIRKASTEKLLTNYTFQLMVSNAADVLKGSIEACGGKCTKTSPKNVEGYFVVVASPENRNKYLKVKKQIPEATVVAPEAVFDGVLRQELRLGRHLLT